MKTIGRLQGEQSFGRVRAHDGFVFGIGWSIRIFIFEDSRMATIGIHFSHHAVGDHDVVCFGAFELMQPQLRLSPLNAIVAFRIAAEERMFTGVHLAIRRNGELPAFVIHPVFVPILEDAVIATATAFPWHIVGQNDLLNLRVVQSLGRGTGESVDEKIIHKKLPS